MVIIFLLFLIVLTFIYAYLYIYYFAYLKIIYLYFILTVLGLHCCTWSFSSCSGQGLLFAGACASHCSGFSCWGARLWYMGFSCCTTQAQQLWLTGPRAYRLQQLWLLGSIVTGFSCFLACGSFQDQESNPSTLHWQVDSYSLYHQGSPVLPIFDHINGITEYEFSVCCFNSTLF